MLTYGAGVALAALAGVMAAPIYQVTAQMGSEIIIVVFAVVVIGGMGSIMGAIVSGFVLGLVEGMTKVFYPEASTTVVFIVMAIVLLVRPAGLFGAPTRAAAAGESHAGVAAGVSLSPSLVRSLTVVLLAAGLIAPLLIYPVFLMKVLCFALFACAFNLLLGYVGLLSFGHAAFYGGASYMTAQAVKIYFAMITLALAQMVFFFAVQSDFTHSDEGIQAVPRGQLLGLIDLGNSLNMYYFVFAVFLFGFWFIHRIIDSPFGSVLKAIRENEPRAISLGYDIDRYKLVAFVLSALFTGMAGALDALVFQLASLTNVHWTMSGHAILMTILGGVGTLTGPIVGALIVAGMENYLAKLGAWVTIIHGGIFIVCVMLFRRGIVGEAALLLRKSGIGAKTMVLPAADSPSTKGAIP
jgi:branched-chain amino acid transport system permease protein